MNKRTVGKIAFWAVYVILLGALGGLWGWQGWIYHIGGAFALLGVGVCIVLLFERVSKKLWPKPGTAAEKEALPKVLIRTALQLAMGGLFAFGVVSAAFALIDGRESGFLLYIGLIALSLVILVILVTVSPLQDRRSKDEIAEVKKEIKNYGKDERLKAIGNRAGYISFGITLLLLLGFGAFIAVFPPENVHVIPMGILGIFGAAVLVFQVLFSLYDYEKLSAEKQYSRSGGLAFFLLSLIPPVLLGVRWITAGLSNMGIAFLAVFLLVAVCLAVNVWYARKHRE